MLGLCVAHSNQNLVKWSCIIKSERFFLGGSPRIVLIPARERRNDRPTNSSGTLELRRSVQTVVECSDLPECQALPLPPGLCL
jgi:hypothetical protein